MRPQVCSVLVWSVSMYLENGCLGVGVMREGWTMIDGRRCDRWNCPITVLIGNSRCIGEYLSIVVNTRS